MKPIDVDPETTTRAEAYELWMSAPNPMVTFFKTLDVAHAGCFLERLQENINRINTYES